MTNIEFANKLKDVATNYKSLYVLGCFGAPLKPSNKNRYCNNYAYNRKPERTAMIMAASDDTFGFDCVCLLKGILWGWNGDVSKPYGGASYQSNGVPDIDESSMINRCSDLSTDFDNIEIGEAVWMKGHIGAYIGNGLAVECTPKWKNGVQITACNKDVPGYNRRDWVKHGKLPYIEYIKEVPKPEPTPQAPEAPKPAETPKTIQVGDVVKINAGAYYYNMNKKVPSWVIAKQWIAKKVVGDMIVVDKSTDGKNAICSPVHVKDLTIVQTSTPVPVESQKPATAPQKKTVDELAREVIQGKWGNGTARKQKLEAAGYNYREVQDLVNKILRG